MEPAMKQVQELQDGTVARDEAGEGYRKAKESWPSLLVLLVSGCIASSCVRVNEPVAAQNGTSDPSIAVEAAVLRYMGDRAATAAAPRPLIIFIHTDDDRRAEVLKDFAASRPPFPYSDAKHAKLSGKAFRDGRTGEEGVIVEAGEIVISGRKAHATGNYTRGHHVTSFEFRLSFREPGWIVDSETFRFAD
jgi:hypothetical protein